MTTLRLWLLLRRRTASGPRDPARLTSALAVVAFGVTTAVALVVVGGLTAFVQRQLTGTGGDESGAYVVLAAFATLLLLVPLSTLGGAAARLAVARRDARLATLRLVGASTGRVATLTVLDAAVQALTGALAGVAGYLALLPLVARLRFQGRAFEVGELWVGVPGLAAAIVAVVLVALASATSSLGRVAISPLGVAARTTPPGMRAARLIALVLAAVGAASVSSALAGAPAAVGIAVTMLLVAGGMATLNLVGPFVLGLVGRVTAARARSAATLLAGRRIADDPGPRGAASAASRSRRSSRGSRPSRRC
ncbi:hypothetical protein [Litorihabitans aurantiacus]|uniref:FtsX-like permease family protein n=1 Tax=Litorihabitans aurantiacus TaxID=1930061 RepID=A0AA37UG36_9MICO|nr:hypothetical protein [Litorihabitans aurantiacus]GMA30018.1 hypothetical protein GCM10025875_00100 [Litorihabitans aurantiacus]